MANYQAFSALKHRNFRLFWLGQIISLTGTWMHQAAQGWLVFKLTDSPFFLGLAGTAFSLPILLFTLTGGVMADRYSKRNILRNAHTILMLLSLILAVLVFTDSVTVWHVIILAFFIGTVHAFEIPARQSFIVEMVGKESLLNAIALNSSAFHGARMIGPAIAGLLMGALSLASCFFINSLSFLAIIIALIKMRFDRKETERSRKSVISEFMAGFKYIKGEPQILTIMISVGIISFFGFPYVTFMPVYARDILGIGPEGLGVLMGSAGAGAFTGSIGLALGGNIRRKGPVMALSGISFSVALMIFSHSNTLWLSYAMLFLVGFGALNHMVTANNLIQLTVPDELRGRVMSSFSMMFLGMAPLGNFVLGSLAHYIGTEDALLTGSTLCLLGILIVISKRPETLKK